MRHFILGLLFTIVYCSDTLSQDAYEVTWEQGTYDTLDNYESVFEIVDLGFNFDRDSFYCIRNFPVPTFLDIGFSFPYFDNRFEVVMPLPMGQVILDLFNAQNLQQIFTFMARPEDENCPFGPLTSDFRLQRGSIDDEKYIAFELINGRLRGTIQDDSIPPPYHQLNFQVWLYESGTIQFKAGEIDLENSTSYHPGSGIFHEGLASYEGPYMGISDLDNSDHYYLKGTFADPIIDNNFTLDNIDEYILLGLPPEGWTITWTRTMTDAVQESYVEPVLNNLDGQVEILSQMDSWVLADIRGQKALEGKERFIDMTPLPTGYYVLFIELDGQLYNRKLFNP